MSSQSSEIKKTLFEFSLLEKAIIDSSSIIYLQKIGLLDTLAAEINLLTVNDVKSECSFSTNISLINENHPLPVDQQIIYLSVLKKMPVISDDYKILSSVKKSTVPYFNSLMMISFLFFKKIISKDDYIYYLSMLKKIARYSDYVWKYGDAVFEEILKRLQF